jgi:hypothetical protein
MVMGKEVHKPEEQQDKAIGTEVCIHNEHVDISGKWLKVARVHDEDWLGGQVVTDPESFVQKLKERGAKADVFTFAQKIPDWKPKYNFRMEWDNVAAIPITSYREWWDRVSSDMRRDVKRAEKRGIVVKEVSLDDEIVQGIVEINNETPIRQGKRFTHYGKDAEAVKNEYSTYPDRSEFIGAFYKDELVGIIKIVYVGELACLMEILSKPSHYDKRPTNAMIAKAVEVSERKGKAYLTYGKYYYGKKTKSSFVDFKHRCGFERILYARYYIPLTLKGKLAIPLKLHLGLIGILPGSALSAFVYIRSLFYRKAPIENE